MCGILNSLDVFWGDVTQCAKDQQICRVFPLSLDRGIRERSVYKESAVVNLT